jgi:hypothetical protein
MLHPEGLFRTPDTEHDADCFLISLGTEIGG